MPSPTQISGARAELAAEEFLRAQGLAILHRNYRRRRGEIDLIARQGDVLVIAEVRMRASARFGGAAASIDVRKQRRIVRAARQLLQHNRGYAALAVRFDALIVEDIDTAVPKVTWLRHAFEAT